MRSSSREEVVEVFDALRADLKRALDLSFDALTTLERFALLQTCETFRRQLPAIEHPLINQVSEQADATELGGKLPAALANRLRITRAEAQRAGDIGPGHVAVIRGFWHHLPDFVDVETRQKAEAQLARLGGRVPRCWPRKAIARS
jgi:hypothetical protein